MDQPRSIQVEPDPEATLASLERGGLDRSWRGFLVGRLAVLVGGLLLISLLATVAVRQVPDPSWSNLGICDVDCRPATPAEPAPDRSFVEDWRNLAWETGHGDLGYNAYTQDTVASQLRDRTTQWDGWLSWAVLGQLSAVVIGLGLALVFGRRSAGVGAGLLRGLAMVGASFPIYVSWLLVSLGMFQLWWHEVPQSGHGSEFDAPVGITMAGYDLRELTWVPIAVLAFALAPIWIGFFARRVATYCEADHAWSTRMAGTGRLRTLWVTAVRPTVLDGLAVAGRTFTLALSMMVFLELLLVVQGPTKYLIDLIYRLPESGIKMAAVLCAVCLVVNVVFDVIRALVDPRVRRPADRLRPDRARFERPHLAGWFGLVV